MSDVVLNSLLSLLAVGALLWGFERYRTQFVKTDLLISVSVAAGLLAIVFAPTIFDYVGVLLNLQRRIFVISLLSNITLLIGILYTISQARDNRSSIYELTRNLSVNQVKPTQADGGTEVIGVVIPAYNEAQTVGNVIKELPDSLYGYSVEPIVVSDGSTDTTLDMARTEASVAVEHPLNQGQGGALKTGFIIAEQRDMAIVVTMDADGQHLSKDLKRLVDPIINDEADYVTGSRHRGSDYTRNSALRRAGIQTFTWLISVLTKSSITDCTNGYRAIRGSELNDFKLTEERFSAPELIIEARKNGLRMKEIPITVEERQAGTTKKPQLTYALGLAWTIFTTWIR